MFTKIVASLLLLGMIYLIVKVLSTFIITNADIDRVYPKVLKKEPKDFIIINHKYDKYLFMNNNRIKASIDYRCDEHYAIYDIGTLPLQCDTCGKKQNVRKEKHIYGIGLYQITGKIESKQFYQLNYYCIEPIVFRGEHRYTKTHERMFRSLDGKKWKEYIWKKNVGMGFLD